MRSGTEAQPVPPAPDQVSDLVAATAHALPEQVQVLARARAFAEPFIAGQLLHTGENALMHADGVALVLHSIGGSEAMQAANYLVHACPHLTRPQEVLTNAFGEQYALLAIETNRLVHIQQQARGGHASAQALADPALQTENVRKMLLAFSRDLRVVMLRLASRLQTLRFCAASRRPVSPGIAHESLHVFAPLANRLGIWQIKWEMEDLAFRFLEPDTYREIARLLDEKRTEREVAMEQLRTGLEASLRARSIRASVQGRPKHIYSIVKKMRGKSLGFDQVFDLRALRVVVPTLKDCYAALSWVHQQFEPIVEEFDDYIARPKPNGYQSLHTVVRDAAGKPIEIQIRTQAMHDHAEHGVAAHWAYKEAGQKGYAGVSASSDYDAKIAVLRQLLAWERELTGSRQGAGLFDDCIYVLTPDAAIVELPQGATPVDFAYSVHTSIGHRCRGARVDGAMVSLDTPLQNGQTVEITVAKEGGPSRDWLNPNLGYLISHRARSKVRAWFNAQASDENVARGREAVERLLQREGRTAMRLDDLAARLGFSTADDLFAEVGKDEYSLRNIEAVLHPAPPLPDPDELLLQRKARPNASEHRPPHGGVLVVGVDSLMTQLAKCCKAAPPDDIRGFVTRGKGVSIHRHDCANFREMAVRSPERVIEVEWGIPRDAATAVYPVDVVIDATDRNGLLRDITEVFAREKTHIISMHTQSGKGRVWMTFTVQVADSRRLAKVLGIVGAIPGIHTARRR